MSRRFTASTPARMSSTFSCDIAHAVSRGGAAFNANAAAARRKRYSGSATASGAWSLSRWGTNEPPAERSGVRLSEQLVVADQPQPGHAHRLIRKRLERIQRRGIRPRDAAFGIVTIWVVAVVVLGVVEHLVDPNTFDTVWLGMWWGVQTVTTLGYGDVVPQDP